MRLDITPAIRTLFGLAILLMVAGCVPNLVTYYRPEAPGIAPLRGGCGLKMENAMRLDAQGVQVLLNYLPAAGERQPGLYIMIQVPAQHRFAFANSVFNLREAPGGAVIPVLGLKVLRDDGEPSVTVPYNPGDVAIDAPGRANLRWYSLVVRTPDLSTPAFTVQWPPVLVNDVAISLPPIHFRQTTSAGITSLNC